MNKVVASDGKIFKPVEDYCWGCKRVVTLSPDPQTLEWGNKYPSYMCPKNHCQSFDSRPWTQDGRGVLDGCPHEEPDFRIFNKDSSGAYGGSTLVCKQCMEPVPKSVGALQINQISAGHTYKVVKNGVTTLSKAAKLLSIRLDTSSPNGWRHYELEWDDPKAPTYINATLPIEFSTFFFFKVEL